jgi:hypothetical protein
MSHLRQHEDERNRFALATIAAIGVPRIPQREVIRAA